MSRAFQVAACWHSEASLTAENHDQRCQYSKRADVFLAGCYRGLHFDNTRAVNALKYFYPTTPNQADGKRTTLDIRDNAAPPAVQIKYCPESGQTGERLLHYWAALF